MRWIMQKMSACEEKVMLVIWQINKLLSYKEIQIGVNERFGDSWKPETVCTFIDRLRKKSYIVPIKEGRYTYCQATLDFDEYRKEQLEEFVDKLYQGDKSKLLDDLAE